MAITVYPQPTQPVSAVALPLPSGASTSALQTQPGVDIGDVTINNAAGAAAVNVQDGGNSLTVDGTVAATQSGTWTVQPGNTANTTAWKVDGSAVTQPVSGTFFQVTQPVSGTVSISGNVEVVNDVGNPLPVNGTVTANLGTLGGAATAANQAIEIAALTDPFNGAYIQQDINGSIARETGGFLENLTALVVAQGVSSTSQAGPMVQGTVDDGSTVLADTVQSLRLNSTGRLLVASNGDDVMWFSPTVIDFVTNGEADPQFFDASW